MARKGKPISFIGPRREQKDKYGIPEVPFYARPDYGKETRRRPPYGYGPGFLERKRQELQEQLARPACDRIGGLRSAVAGDFTPEEMEMFLALYGRERKA